MDLYKKQGEAVTALVVVGVVGVGTFLIIDLILNPKFAKQVVKEIGEDVQVVEDVTNATILEVLYIPKGFEESAKAGWGVIFVTPWMALTEGWDDGFTAYYGGAKLMEGYGNIASFVDLITDGREYNYFAPDYNQFNVGMDRVYAERINLHGMDEYDYRWFGMLGLFYYNFSTAEYKKDKQEEKGFENWFTERFGDLYNWLGQKRVDADFLAYTLRSYNIGNPMTDINFLDFSPLKLRWYLYEKECLKHTDAAPWLSKNDDLSTIQIDKEGDNKGMRQRLDYIIFYYQKSNAQVKIYIRDEIFEKLFIVKKMGRGDISDEYLQKYGIDEKNNMTTFAFTKDEYEYLSKSLSQLNDVTPLVS